MCSSEKVTDLSRLSRIKWAGRCEVVDEVSVALIGWDSTRRRMRLYEKSLLLWPGKLISNGCGRDTHARRVNEVGRTHWLRCRYVLMYDSAENRSLTVVEHPALNDIDC